MLSLFRPSFEVVKEGRILHLVSGHSKYLVDKRYELSNQSLIRDMAGIIKLEKDLFTSSKVKG